MTKKIFISLLLCIIFIFSSISCTKPKTSHITPASDKTQPAPTDLAPSDSKIISNAKPEIPVSAIVKNKGRKVPDPVKIAFDEETSSSDSDLSAENDTPFSAISESLSKNLSGEKDLQATAKANGTTASQGDSTADDSNSDEASLDQPVTRILPLRSSAGTSSGGENSTRRTRSLAGNPGSSSDTSTPEVENLIGSGGGTATSSDGKAKVVIPAGAVSGSVVITVEVEDTTTLQDASPTDTTLVSAADFGPDGLIFNKPVTIILPMDTDQVPGTPVRLALYNPATNTFEDTGTVAPVNLDNTVSFDVTHFSTYGALKSLIPTGVPIGGGVQIPTPGLFTGSFTHSIPITVPPGRKEIQPGLQLQYRSSNPNSWVGMGWSLNPGYITRGTKKGPPAYNDEEDTFIYIAASSATEMVKIVDNLYQAKVESRFTRFFKENDDSWKVIQKDGTIIRFGTTANSRVTSSNGTFSWMITRITDPNGNYIDFDYTKDKGAAYLSTIQYTGNANTGFTPKHLVNFILEDRDDITSSYISGAQVITAKRIKEIEVKVIDELAWRYIFVYEYSEDTNRSLLKSVTQYSPDGLSPPSNTFTYQKAGQ